ncbi:MAG: hypothetical protein JW703_02430 [Candidatus Diapherotrites archaeon]|nr:hypothetical protein [Candidatus Diapherotrites archaeon]
MEWSVRDMSLITLTFGNGNLSRNPYFGNSAHTGVRSPISGLKNKSGTIKVKKICQFFNVDELYIIGEVMEGAISESMKAIVNGNQCTVKEVESKYGAIGKKGLLIGALVQGLDKEDVEIGQEIRLGLE